MIATMSLPLATLLPEATGCADCGERLRQRLAAMAAVAGVCRSAAGDRLLIHYDAGAVSPAALAAAAQAQAAGLARRYVHRVLPVSGLDCADCARTLGEGLRALAGVERAAVDFAAGTLTIEYDADRIGLAAIAGRVAALGYAVASAGAVCSDFRVGGLDCADCARTLERVIAAQPGVLAVMVDFAGGRARVTHDPAAAPVAAIRRRAAAAGYTADPVDASAPAAPVGIRAWLHRRETGLALAAAALLLAGAGWLAGWPAAVVNAAYGLAIVAGGWRTARAGWVALRATRAPDMNALMTLAVLGAVAIGEWSEGALIVVLFALGTTLEGLTVERARQSISRLLRLAPETATVLGAGGPSVEPVASVPVGATVLVRPGERLPLDGVVLEGRSAVDQAPITGESVPVDKEPGAAVYAGTVNGAGALVIRTTAPAGETTLARIVRLVERAQAERAPVQRFVDRFARWYTPVVVAGAALLAVVPPLAGAPFGEWFYRGLVLLVIACPCALVISTPVAIVAALGSAARQGILIKGGAHLETLGRLRAIAFDKTGTLTRGRPGLTEVVALDGRDRDAVLALAAGLEAHSEHPVAAAIVAGAQARGLTPVAAGATRALAGQGLEAVVDGRRYRLGAPRLFAGHPAFDAATAARVGALEERGQTVAMLGDDTALLGLLAVADQPRPEAAAALAGLRRLGIGRLVMLTGDNVTVARAIAERVGVTEVRAGLLPEEKTAAVAALQAAGPVAMVGDGINDTPALARASVGIAMGAGGTAAALETAGVALMADDLTRLPVAVRLGQRALAIIGQNIAAALAIKALFLALAALGLADLWLAVLADMGGSLLVTFNALRLLRVAGPPAGAAGGGHAGA
jgi:Cd2+/Zn2+-exporting ATPase